MFSEYSLLDDEMLPSLSALTCGTFATGSIRVRTAPMLRIHGYSQLDQVHPQINEAVERMAKHAEGLFEPGTWYRLLKIKHIEGNRLTLETGTVLQCDDFANALIDCTAVVVFILTMGKHFDSEAETLSSDGNVFDLLFFETAGWLGIEEATRTFATRLRACAIEHGYGLTRRLAPGYDTWPLTDQQSLFSLFQGIPLSVQLLESCAMVPTMSRSGMYGLRPRWVPQVRK